MPGFEPRVFFEKNAGNEGPTRSCLTNCTTGNRASVQFLLSDRRPPTGNLPSGESWRERQ